VSALGLAGGAPSASLGPAGQLFVMPVAASVGGGIVLDIHSLENAPAPARLTLYVPAGVTVDTSAAPGTVVGDGYLAVWLDAATTDDYAFGTIKAGDPAAAQTCAPGIHAAVWIASFRLSITFCANGSVATRMCLAWYSCLESWLTWVSYSARSSCSVGLRSFRYFSATACCSTFRRVSSSNAAVSGTLSTPSLMADWPTTWARIRLSSA